METFVRCLLTKRLFFLIMRDETDLKLLNFAPVHSPVNCQDNMQILYSLQQEIRY